MATAALLRSLRRRHFTSAPFSAYRYYLSTTAQTLAPEPPKRNQSWTSTAHHKPENGSGFPPSPSLTSESPPFNPYRGKSTIKARVTAKSQLRSYKNERGEGRVFHFNLLNHDGEVRATCFNSVAEQFYSLILVGQVYSLSRVSLRPASKKFNPLNSDYEIIMEANSKLQICIEDDGSIPQQKFDFRLLSKVEHLEKNSVVDVIGVVTSISPAVSGRRKNGTEIQKRTLQLTDLSCRSVQLTLWDKLCTVQGQELQTMCESGLFPVLAVKAGRVNDYCGKELMTMLSTQLFIEPKISQTDEVRVWFDREGKDSSCVSISMAKESDILKTISLINDEKLGTSGKPDWITVTATVSSIESEKYFYEACPIMIGDRQCKKKVTNNGDGTWRCERCDQSVEQCDHMYKLKLQIKDHTSSWWVTAFQESGEEIMGITAKELHELEKQDEEKFEEMFENVYSAKFILKLKVKERTTTVVKADKINSSAESRFRSDLVDN